MNKLIGDYIVGLGFSQEAGKLYGALVEKGPLTILEASRASEVERTALYRLVEDLTAKGLIEEVLEHKSRRVRAVEPAKVKLLVEQEKKRVGELENSFTSFEAAVGQIPDLKSTQVRYYRGTAGIKQIMWNETKAKKELLG
jgi:sugar-specific transcriptional regulator TrmB